ncbi:MAG: PAS domain-containing protein, partial [Pseudomonadota bacterium]
MSVRPSRLRTSRPNWIAAQALALICITVTLGLILGLQTRAQFGEIDLSQRAYAEETAAKGALISDLRDTLGYGGVIHNFKNFVLRQDIVYLLETEEQIARFRETIDRYVDLAPTPQERAALDEIAAAISAYEGMLPLAIAAAEQDWSPARTDAAVRVDDAGALAALAELERLWRAARGANTERVANAVEQGRALIWVGFLALGALLLAALVIGYLLWLLHRDLRQTLVRLNGELDERRALEQAQSRLATIVEQAPTTILLTDTSGRIEYANAKFEALTGWSRAEIAGQTPAFL